jgi:hypothetical protein
MEIFFILHHQGPVVILWPVIMHLAMCIYLDHDHKGINIEFLSHYMKENSVKNLLGTVCIKIAFTTYRLWGTR